MKTFSGAKVLASALALLALAAIVGLAAALFLPHDEHLWPITFVVYACLVPLALWAWSGGMFRHRGSSVNEPLSWRDWVQLFFLGFVLSAVFVAFDMAVRHPGLSLAFTFSAVGLTLVALPGALRAWLLETLTPDDA